MLVLTADKWKKDGFHIQIGDDIYIKLFKPVGSTKLQIGVECDKNKFSIGRITKEKFLKDTGMINRGE